MRDQDRIVKSLTRRYFFNRLGTGIGAAALASLFEPQPSATTGRRSIGGPSISLSGPSQAVDLLVHVGRTLSGRPVRS